MLGPEFEKQVQQKLDAFQVPPSDAVWQAVEKEIQAKKKRRRILFWWPAAALLLAGLTYWILPGFKNTTLQKPIVTITKEPLPVETKNEPVAPADAVNYTTPGAVKKTAPVIVTSPIVKTPPLVSNQQKETVSKKYTLVKKTDALLNTAAKTTYNANSHARPASNKHAANKTAAVANNLIAITKSEEAPATKAIANAATKNDTSIFIAASEPVLSSTTSNENRMALQQQKLIVADTALLNIEKKTTEKKQQRWQWGLQQSTGVARLISGGFFSVFQSENKSFDNAFSSGTNGVPAVIIYKANPVKAGLHFAISGVAQKKLTTKTNIVLGLQYQYNKNSLLVGVKIDTPVTVLPGVVVADRSQTAYQAGSDNIYKIRQHLIVLPVSLQTRISKTEKKPVLLTYGLQLGWQLSNNFLHFGNTTGRYFTNNDYNSQLQAGMHTGLYFTLYNRQQQVIAGPTVQYYFSSLFNNQTNTRRLFTAGLTTTIFFKK